ncbi:AAA family ATPase [Castellaniella sp.]|uniref:AAA family ATPase n=1 Tax=Castellaniella sp. TaxID=1955812 RepID=UPI003C733A09
MKRVVDTDRETKHLSVRECFGLDSDLEVMAFTESSDYVPAVDPNYRFDPDTTLAILAGFSCNRRVLIQGMHGTGKSTHIEQVAARLNWPCIRVNLDGHISRLDLVGRDAIVLRDGQQITEFKEGILPWALQRPMALVLDEYDAGRPEVMFVLQRILERDGHFTLLDQNRVIAPHSGFRLFATANSVGLGDTSGLYYGVQRLNHAQLDRWNIVAALNYLSPEAETEIVAVQVPALNNPEGRRLIAAMVEVATLTRAGFQSGDLSTLMSPRTLISWAENLQIFSSTARAFRYAFLNKCDPSEQDIVAEYYQRCFDEELAVAASASAPHGSA